MAHYATKELHAGYKSALSTASYSFNMLRSNLHRRTVGLYVSNSCAER